MDIAVQEVVDEASRSKDEQSGYEFDVVGARLVPRSIINSWKIIDISRLKSTEAKAVAYRLNCLGSLYYFALRCLQKNKLQTNSDIRKNLHYLMCAAVMKDGLKEVIEIPRDHFKSTIYSECFPMWRALPFTEQDEIWMRKFGMGDLFIEWMKRAHKQDIRIILISETIKNAAKLGQKIRNHYENNDFFRELFKDILPDSSCTWTNESLTHRRSKSGKAHGEGTFDFIGVGAALQSRHYDMAIEDDMFGRAALRSEVETEAVIEYHQLLVGAMDADNTNAGRDNDEIVVGNRWSFKDLNSHIRRHEKYFNFISHSALGGCCPLHKIGEPIFPEAFNIHKLARWKQRLGSYLFSCQFLNFPINPEQCKFKKADLRFFLYERTTDAFTFNPEHYDEEQKKSYRIAIRHQVFEGVTEEDVYPRNLQRYMIIDPNHSAQKGRCRHAITITGVRQKPRRVYLLAAWAQAVDMNSFVEKIFEMALAFKVTKIHLETIAFQKFLKFHLEYYVQVNSYKNPALKALRFIELKSAHTANAKFERIDSFVPIVERNEFWVNPTNGYGFSEFIEELEAYGNSNGLVDVLDTLGYGTQVWQFDSVDDSELAAFLNMQKNNYRRAMRAS